MAAILRKEILENISTYRFFILTGMLVLLMAVSLVVSYGDYHLRMENYNVLRPQGSDVQKIILPPEPLSIYAKGLDANLGRLYSLSALGIEVHASQESDNHLFALFAVPDMLFVIKVILAFIAVLFSFDAICGEKEQGTLKLLLSIGAKRGHVVVAKLLGRFALVAIPFGFLFLSGAVVVSLLPDVDGGWGYWSGVLLLLLVAGGYALLWIGIGTLVSSLAHRSATAMVYGLAFWVGFVFVIPNLGVTIAQSVSDIPPGDRVEMENRLASVQAIYEAIQQAKNTGDQRSFAKIMTQVREANSHLFEIYLPKLNGLVSTTRTALRCSPSGALGLLATELAHTGLSRDVTLKSAVWLYIDRNFKRLGGIATGEVDKFQLASPTAGDILAGGAFVDVLVMIAFCGVFIGLAIWRFMGYDVR
jgi:ABC-type transport system involved in multi-copper enzyme maturation permease subunit